MKFRELERKGLIQEFARGPGQARAQLARAREDLETSRQLLSRSPDWAFSIAYNAALRAGRALLFSEGYRPRRGEGHVAVVRFLEAAIGESRGREVRVFDRLRRKRHQTTYEVTGRASDKEAKEALAFAERFVGVVEDQIDSPP